jgi:hypothetical protein
LAILLLSVCFFAIADNKSSLKKALTTELSERKKLKTHFPVVYTVFVVLEVYFATFHKTPYKINTSSTDKAWKYFKSAFFKKKVY